MHEPICAVCGDNSGWIADPVYGWLQCANCNDERMKPKPNTYGFEKGELPSVELSCEHCGVTLLSNEGQFVYTSLIPLKVACLTCAPAKEEPTVRDNRRLFRKREVSSRLEFAEFTSDEDFFDHVAKEGLEV